jgi:hypothetical protein
MLDLLFSHVNINGYGSITMRFKEYCGLHKLIAKKKSKFSSGIFLWGEEREKLR